MDHATASAKKPRAKRTERGEEAKSGGGEAKRRPPQVKLEQQSEAGKGEKPRRSGEEGVPKDKQGKPQWRPLRKKRWSRRRPAL